jgi:predicted dehydrogenase
MAKTRPTLILIYQGSSYRICIVPRHSFKQSAKTMRTLAFVATLLSLICSQPLAQEVKRPIRFAIIGLSHDHARGFIPSARNRTDVQLAGIVEPDEALAARYAKNYKLDESLFHPNLDHLLGATNIEAVAIFTSTFDHKRVVEECAPRGLTIMMEKPLAVNMEHARAIQAAAQKAGAKILVNYETTWYPSNQEAYSIVHDQNAIGEIRKMVVHDGHRGPKEIGCSEDFLRWLTDPVLNGGGALTDFGCYGANLMTWLMKGQRPTSVFAVTQQVKPAIYPKVDDEATIVLTYPNAQGIVQASWNWPYDRKDMEVYGQSGQLLVPRRDLLKLRSGNAPEKEQTVSPLQGAIADPLSYLAAVARGEITPSGLSSLEINMVVTEILDAARKSAQTGQRVELK